MELSKYQHRNLSSFVGMNLLLDYILRNLDSERYKATEEFLFDNPVAQKELQLIKNNLTYIESLKNIEFSNELKEQVQTPSSYWEILILKSNWQQWPLGLRWAVEAFVVISLVAIFSYFTPWTKLERLAFKEKNQPVVITEVHRSTKTDETIAITKKTMEPVAKGDSADENQIAQDIIEPSKTPTVDSKTDSVKASEVKSILTPAGILFRAHVRLGNNEDSSLAVVNITSKITELGGQKAGSVDLGWQKGNYRYFHFTLPEENYEKLVNSLKLFGNYRVNKEPHARKMPDGIIRVILHVEPGKIGSEQ